MLSGCCTATLQLSRPAGAAQVCGGLAGGPGGPAAGCRAGRRAGRKTSSLHSSALTCAVAGTSVSPSDALLVLRRPQDCGRCRWGAGPPLSTAGRPANALAGLALVLLHSAIIARCAPALYAADMKGHPDQGYAKPAVVRAPSGEWPQGPPTAACLVEIPLWPCSMFTVLRNQKQELPVPPPAPHGRQVPPAALPG